MRRRMAGSIPSRAILSWYVNVFAGMNQIFPLADKQKDSVPVRNGYSATLFPTCG